ncbi:uncharacterized protein DSM5745_10281 [Aspergillus mulundensis]|uniref:Uncharacterized protein n=1 Tax=Aspergillus mulundensis TaxID=1810919 RepID=A0A3D8QNE8_9EURO|nr:Uncharacterized protein DSM5745_10281 [Aspergillus mulundensis]RDW63170.1 Uncharacterized protein DSM5745_10281 [Aspergillus mulundensis]
MDDLQVISGLAHELSDLELALLICLGGQEHCLIEATEGNIHDVAAELALICSHTYGLTCTIVEFSDTTSLEDFRDQVCSHSRNKPASIVDVVIAKNFDHAPESIQVEALELMRSRKLTTGGNVLEASTHFLFIPIVVRDSAQVRPKLNAHLNDNLFISHFHDSEDGYVYLEEDDWMSEGQESLSSVVRRPRTQDTAHSSIDHELLDALHSLSKTVKATAELVRYQQDIVVFLRLSRAVAGGISARSSIQFSKLAKYDNYLSHRMSQ